MITENSNANSVVTCDGCGSEEYVPGNFYDVIIWLQYSDWKTNKSVSNGTSLWEHYCPECKEAEGME